MSLAFDPAAGELSDKISFDIDITKFVPLHEWKSDHTPAVLLACGSYSPPTIMHTRIFETGRDFFHVGHPDLKIQIVGGFMSPVHVAYGKKSLFNPEFTKHRVEMVKAAVESSDWINIDEWEVKQNEWTRTRIAMDRMAIDLNKKFGTISSYCFCT